MTLETHDGGRPPKGDRPPSRAPGREL